MSPVSRGRNGQRSPKPAPRPAPPPEVALASEACDCAACSGEELEPHEIVEGLLDGAADLVDSEDPVEAELMGALLLTIGSVAGERFEEEVLVPGFIPMFEARASTAAMAMLLGIAAVSGGPAGAAARTAADRLAVAGVAPPRWAEQIGQPITAGDCLRLSDPTGVASALVGSFHRAGRAHALVVTVDHLDCDAASELFLLPGEDLPEVLVQLRAGLASTAEVSEQRLDQAEFRWHMDSALAARAAHDADLSDEDLEESLADEEGGPGYSVIAALAQARMSLLPVSGKPMPDHAADHSAGNRAQ